MNLKISFLGAADGVTGSRSLIEWEGKKWLIDCGLFQGPKEVRDLNRSPLSFNPGEIEAVILTHAHLDHSGYLPCLFKNGYKGPVKCSVGTAELAQILLRDAAFLEEETARYANETKYSHHNPAIPLFTSEDAETAISHLQPLPRDVWQPFGQHARFRFIRAGHIIGASLVQIEFGSGPGRKIVTFSGDLGHNRSFVLRGPQEGIETDALILESTYGGRTHPKDDVLEAFSKVFNRTMSRNGVLVIPAFAVGRAQEITYMIRLLEDQKRIPIVPVVLDSPMAIAAMDICLNHHEDRAMDTTGPGPEAFKPHEFQVSRTPDQSLMTCMQSGPMVVISASGMLSGGRILHHLKRRLPDENSTILFCGYQAEGTKGRFLQENAGSLKELRIHHQNVEINAEIATIDHLSAHSDHDDLITWVSRLRRLPSLVLLNHGNPAGQEALAKSLHDKFGIKATTTSTRKSFGFHVGVD